MTWVTVSPESAEWSTFGLGSSVDFLSPIHSQDRAEGGDLSYFASDQVEPGLHTNSLLTLRDASVKKIDRAVGNCVAVLPKQKLDFRFKRSGPLPIMEFVFTSPC